MRGFELIFEALARLGFFFVGLIIAAIGLLPLDRGLEPDGLIFAVVGLAMAFYYLRDFFRWVRNDESPALSEERTGRNAGQDVAR